MLSLTLVQACFLFVIAILGGALTSIAGGGGFILFPALIFIGLPSIHANATSMVAGWLGCLVSLGAYRHELRAQRRISFIFGSTSLVGGTIGAFLLLHTPIVTFDRLVPYLLLLSTLLFTFGSKMTSCLHNYLKQVSNNSWHLLVIASFVQFCIAIYGGFHGAGVAILILATLEMIGMKEIHEMNALKMLLMSCITGFAAVTYAIAQVIVWQPAFLMAIGAVIGGYSSAYYARQLPSNIVRYFVTITGFAMTCYFFVREYVS
ncbi:MAG: sulfite exporter TauE/SafE family protein [Iphinoe sp. HA4291-MV1]|jgi:hypothetical protein|nr:sulfite exporter TauE/SafE family protein [Iphinoe sp. HA4291-MV1]